LFCFAQQRSIIFRCVHAVHRFVDFCYYVTLRASKRLLTSIQHRILRTADGRLNVNVALNRRSYLSSVYTDLTHGLLGPSKGNDGDKTNCADGASNSLAHTDVNTVSLHPWFVVDLGTALQIAGVNLTNRADWHGM